MPREVGILAVVVLKARNLQDKHTLYKQDAFCQIILDGKNETTPVDVKGGQHPVWDAELRFKIFEGQSETMEVSCWSKEPRGVDCIGRGKLDIGETLKNGEFDDWVKLEENSLYRGEVYLEMTYFPATPATAAAPAAIQSQLLQRRPSKMPSHQRLARLTSDHAYPAAPPTPSQVQAHITAAPPRRSPPQSPPALPAALRPASGQHLAPPGHTSPGYAAQPLPGAEHTAGKLYVADAVPTARVPSILRPGNAHHARDADLDLPLPMPGTSSTPPLTVRPKRSSADLARAGYTGALGQAHGHEVHVSPAPADNPHTVSPYAYRPGAASAAQTSPHPVHPGLPATTPPAAGTSPPRHHHVDPAAYRSTQPAATTAPGRGTSPHSAPGARTSTSPHRPGASVAGSAPDSTHTYDDHGASGIPIATTYSSPRQSPSPPRSDKAHSKSPSRSRPLSTGSASGVAGKGEEHGEEAHVHEQSGIPIAKKYANPDADGAPAHVHGEGHSLPMPSFAVPPPPPLHASYSAQPAQSAPHAPPMQHAHSEQPHSEYVHHAPSIPHITAHSSYAFGEAGPYPDVRGLPPSESELGGTLSFPVPMISTPSEDGYGHHQHHQHQSTYPAASYAQGGYSVYSAAPEVAHTSPPPQAHHQNSYGPAPASPHHQQSYGPVPASPHHQQSYGPAPGSPHHQYAYSPAPAPTPSPHEQGSYGYPAPPVQSPPPHHQGTYGPAPQVSSPPHHQTSYGPAQGYPAPAPSPQHQGSYPAAPGHYGQGSYSPPQQYAAPAHSPSPHPQHHQSSYGQPGYAPPPQGYAPPPSPHHQSTYTQQAYGPPPPQPHHQSSYGYPHAYSPSPYASAPQQHRDSVPSVPPPPPHHTPSPAPSHHSHRDSLTPVPRSPQVQQAPSHHSHRESLGQYAQAQAHRTPSPAASHHHAQTAPPARDDDVPPPVPPHDPPRVRHGSTTPRATMRTSPSPPERGRVPPPIHRDSLPPPYTPSPESTPPPTTSTFPAAAPSGLGRTPTNPYRRDPVRDEARGWEAQEQERRRQEEQDEELARRLDQELNVEVWEEGRRRVGSTGAGRGGGAGMPGGW